jgi:hypothetical protein
MFRLFRERGLALSAAIAMACCGSASRADGSIAGLPTGQQAVSRISAPATLGAISNPRPYRRTRIVTCDTTLLGSPGTCLIGLGNVPAGQLLQIDKIDCAGLEGAFLERVILFNTKLTFDDHLVANFPTGPTHILIADGPFYFRQGEVPRIATAGHATTDQAYCSVTGTLWTAN